jgi:hypothetical protein
MNGEEFNLGGLDASDRIILSMIVTALSETGIILFTGDS